MLSINLLNVNKIVELIFKAYGFSNIELNDVVLLTVNNYKRYWKNRTQYDSLNNVLYFYNAPDLTQLENFVGLAHECWHAVQKNIYKLELRYERQHCLKYGEYEGHPAYHMFMFCKYYDFECEANGYAQALLYFIMKSLKYVKNFELSDEILNFCSQPVYFDINDVDTEEDYLLVKNKLKQSYDKSIDYFKSILFNSYNEALEIFKQEVTDINKIEKFTFLSNALMEDSLIHTLIKIGNETNLFNAK